MTRRLIHWAASLYPRAWRERYREEFIATLEDMPAPGWAAVWDAWKGALAMQVHHYGSKVVRMAAIFGLAGLALAWGVSLQIPDQFRAVALVGTSSMDAASVQRTVQRALSRPRLKELIEKHGLYAAERERLPLEDLIEKMRKNTRVSVRTGKDPARHALDVGFAYESGPVSQRVTNDLAAAILQEERVAKDAGLFTVLDSAGLPSPIYPNRPLIAFLGLLGGLFLGAAWNVLRLHRS